MFLAWSWAYVAIGQTEAWPWAHVGNGQTEAWPWVGVGSETTFGAAAQRRGVSVSGRGVDGVGVRRRIGVGKRVLGVVDVGTLWLARPRPGRTVGALRGWPDRGLAAGRGRGDFVSGCTGRDPFRWLGC